MLGLTGPSRIPLHSLQSTLSKDIIARALPDLAETGAVPCHHVIDSVTAQSMQLPMEQVNSFCSYIFSTEHNQTQVTVERMFYPGVGLLHYQ